MTFSLASFHLHAPAAAAALAFGAAMSFAAPAALAQPEPRLDVIYVPTPQQVVDRMVELANVTPKDRVVDLGCGDGRMVVAAARRGARGLGVDINPVRIKEANANAKKASVTDLVEFRIGDLFKQDISDRDVILMYLLTDINLRLRPQILDTMKPGSRVVSHAFSMGDWEPDQRETVDHRTVYFWIVPAKVEGNWQFEGDHSFSLDLKQQFQMVSGKSTVNGNPATVNGRLRGTEITLTLDVNGKKQELKGWVDGNRIFATDGKWRASRS